MHIIDFGCGKSYLTFAMYYYLHELKGLTLEVTGLDLKTDVIVQLQRAGEEISVMKGFRFLHGDIADYDGDGQRGHGCDAARLRHGDGLCACIRR